MTSCAIFSTNDNSSSFGLFIAFPPESTVKIILSFCPNCTTDTQAVYCHNLAVSAPFWTFFQKSFSGRPGITISAISYAPIRQIRQNYPLPGLFPKSPSTVPFLSNFFSKIFASPPLTVRKSEQKRYTLAALFSKKICLSTADYRQNTQKRSHPFGTFFKIS